MPGQPWTQEELDSLLWQVIAERKPLPKLSVPGKTTAAINNQRRRLKEAGRLESSFTGLRHVPWTICELRQLARLTGEHGFRAAFIEQLQLIPGRSEHAISKMMGRHGLGSASRFAVNRKSIGLAGGVQKWRNSRGRSPSVSGVPTAVSGSKPLRATATVSGRTLVRPACS